MRASRRSVGGTSSGKDLSSTPHSSSRDKDHSQRSEWQQYSTRLRHSFSPTNRDQSHCRSRKRSTSAGGRSVSVERAGYNEAPTMSRQHEHGTHQQQQQQQQRDLPPPSLSAPFRRFRVSLPAGSNLAGDVFRDDFRRKHLHTDSPSDLRMDVNPKLTRVVKVREFHHPHVVNGGDAGLTSSKAVIDDQGMLVQKPMYLDGGSLRTFLPLPPEQSGYSTDATDLNPTSVGGSTGRGTLRIDVRDVEELRRRGHLKAATYDKEAKQTNYFRDASYPVVFSSNRRSLGCASSSSTARDEYLVHYREDLSLPFDRFGGKSGHGSFGGDFVNHDEYGPAHPLDTVKQRNLSPSPVRDEHRGHGYVELGRRERDDYRFLRSNEPKKKMKWVSRSEYGDVLGPRFPDPLGRRIDDIDASPRIIGDPRLWESQHCLEGDTISDYQEIKRVREEFLGGTGNVPVAHGAKSSHDGNFLQMGRTHRYGRDSDLVTFRERSRSPQRAECHSYILRRDHSPRGRIDENDIDMYEPPFERVLEKNYITEEEINILRETRNARAIELSEEDQWGAQERRMDEVPPRRSGFDRARHKMFPHGIPESDAWLPSDNSSVHPEGSWKRRLKPMSYRSFSFDRRQDFHRPYRFWKKGNEYRQTMSELDGDLLEDEETFVKHDPPEESDEFKQQVLKAFLRFTKSLNEDLHQQNRYRDPSKAHSLLCCVCGSLSKEFMDTHSLVTHAFHSLKVGLRTEHLALHKALCVLMGWNWDVIPDNSRVYQMSPVPEFKALKEDLIIWPPVVVIHDVSIGTRSVDEPKAATSGCLEETLKDMKFEAGKVKVCGGKPSNPSIRLVKFMPTFSGLQEADRLHKHYINKKHGRKELNEAKENGIKEAEPQAEVEQLVYGYMGTMEDLDKLDPETKKRCMLKSMKEIESIADAPLKSA